MLDRAPAPGEWSLRETLAHTIGVERSYRANTRHALVRRDEEPLTLSAELRPQPDPADTSGGALDILAAFAARRAETDAALAGLDADQMVRPSQWGPYEVPHRIDVRFRLHRFASHIVEHTVQCEKALESLGFTLNDPRAVVRSIGATRGAHERRSPRTVLDALDAALHARVDAIGV
ncbi:MAG TPA: DinB family protein [Candidatus Limnocylindria bacterium]|nr:DinB family protein [Candidatus Limnocylindria bacterium]